MANTQLILLSNLILKAYLLGGDHEALPIIAMTFDLSADPWLTSH